MFLEIPDKVLIIDNPVFDDIKRELFDIRPHEDKDNCIDLCRTNDEFMQAILSQSQGFTIRFNIGNKIYQSRKHLSDDETLIILQSYYENNDQWKNMFAYTMVAEKSKMNPFKRIKNSIAALLLKKS